MELVRYIILERVALNMYSNKYLRGMPSYVTNTQKLSGSLLKIPQTVATSPTVSVQTHGIVNKSMGKQIINKEQLDHRGCQRQVFLASPYSAYIQALKLLLGKGASFELEITVSLVMGLWGLM